MLLISTIVKHFETLLTTNHIWGLGDAYKLYYTATYLTQSMSPSNKLNSSIKPAYSLQDIRDIGQSLNDNRTTYFGQESLSQRNLSDLRYSPLYHVVMCGDNKAEKKYLATCTIPAIPKQFDTLLVTTSGVLAYSDILQCMSLISTECTFAALLCCYVVMLLRTTKMICSTSSG